MKMKGRGANQRLKIALTIPTGRPKVKKVVKLFLENALKYGYNLSQFSVYLSIDTEYKNTNIEDFFLDSDLENKLGKVLYVTKEVRAELSKKIVKRFSFDLKVVKKLFSGNGYSPQRNSALFYALLDKNDVAICIDDDEFPFVPIKLDDGSVTWKEMDFFTPHVEALVNGTDITRGPYLGYQSPIPSDFEKDIPEQIRKKLGEALQIGNDVITGDSFFKLMNQIKYLSLKEVETPYNSYVVSHGKHGKHIYSGNMGINLHSVRKGKVPIFYTPPKSRGEDTIFALQLKGLVVREVSSYIFHDPFDMYSGIFENKFPRKLISVPVTEETKQRFANALIGWLKYAPILIAMTSKNKSEMNKKTEKMLDKIKEPTEELSKILNCPEINKSYAVLKKYYKSVEEHYDGLKKSQKLWKNKIIPGMILK